MQNARDEDGVGYAGHIWLKFFCGREGQAAFAVEKFFQPLVLGTARAPDYCGRNEFAHFTAMTPPFQPVFVADGAFNRDAGDF